MIKQINFISFNSQKKLIYQYCDGDDVFERIKKFKNDCYEIESKSREDSSNFFDWGYPFDSYYTQIDPTFTYMLCETIENFNLEEELSKWEVRNEEIMQLTRFSNKMEKLFDFTSIEMEERGRIKTLI